MGLQLKPDMAIVRLSDRWNAKWPHGLIEGYIVNVTPDIFRQEVTATDGHVIDVIEHSQGFTFTVKTTGPMIPVKPEGNRIDIPPPGIELTEGAIRFEVTDNPETIDTGPLLYPSPCCGAESQMGDGFHMHCGQCGQMWRR